ncbi:histidine kinase [Lactiplantibacillus pentosus]|uniref:Histidine protein kinase PlnB sensor protein n=1 Tax=Lactiplantibacillus pentosus IG1 TaxID=1042160 RepID=G0M3K2_LACPE|nr:GHKL domain-containing protein [Lactiplantibacillus pentosus]CCC16707.1 histidine protein kinase PlnB; sensor protein [Lactiplantibacillus pentosus IG1]MCT3282194.1 GHKL domain-containing protein [Lactiplantibacillus pentosus]MCT3302480.1 GHKL domain-containing protein [Lactiplantibacillus pentosus]PRO80891.1 histidine kinase [Lactiplantibacillus pentosus]PRO81577.1 histidine kinase [Lactiplantibacillus pentosus]
MLDFGVVDTFYQGFASILVVLLWYYFLSGLLNWMSFLRIVGATFIWGILSVFVADFIFLIMILMNFARQLIQKKRLNYTKNSIFLSVVTIQILIGNIAMFLGRMIVRGLYDVSNLMGMQHYTHELLIVYIAVLLTINGILLFFYRRYWNKVSSVAQKIKELNLNKSLFELILILYVAIESIMLISLNENITATIQLALITAFIVMLMMMLWQMVFFVQSYMKKQAADYQAQQNAQLNDYLKSVERQYLELRKFKHDYKNLMLSLQDSLTNGNSPEQTEYFKELIAQSAVKTSLDSGKIVKVQHLGNETLRGLIVQKFLDAQAKGINLSVELNTENFVIHHELVDIIRIIGNLLDNAIEQAQKMTDKTVTITFNKIDDTTEISINNAIDSNFERSKLFQTGYATKGTNRGLGLANVRELVNQHHDFYLNIDSERGYVTMTLIINGG